MRFILRGRRSIWSSWIVIPVPPRIVSDVSFETRINHEVHFAWQAQYLVKVTLVAGAALGEILIDSWSVKLYTFHTKCVSKVGRGRSPRRRVRDDDVSSDYPRIILGWSSNRLYIDGSNSGIFR